MSAGAIQPGLPFPPLRVRAELFVEGPANHDALARLAAWREGMERPARPLAYVAAVTGPEGAGKSMLLRHEADRFGVAVRGPQADFEAVMQDGEALVVDDAHRLAPLDLFALIEAAAGHGLPLLLAGAERLADWAGQGRNRLPDLASRLGSIAHASLGPPDEGMLAAVLRAQLERRGLRAPTPALAEAAAKLRREFAAAIGLAEAAERLSTQGYRRPAQLLRDALAAAPQHAL